MGDWKSHIGQIDKDERDTGGDTVMVIVTKRVGDC